MSLNNNPLRVLASRSAHMCNLLEAQGIKYIPHDVMASGTFVGKIIGCIEDMFAHLSVEDRGLFIEILFESLDDMIDKVYEDMDDLIEDRRKFHTASLRKCKEE